MARADSVFPAFSFIGIARLVYYRSFTGKRGSRFAMANIFVALGSGSIYRDSYDENAGFFLARCVERPEMGTAAQVECNPAFLFALPFAVGFRLVA